MLVLFSCILVLIKEFCTNWENLWSNHLPVFTPVTVRQFIHYIATYAFTPTCSIMLLLGQNLSHMFEGDLFPKCHCMVARGWCCYMGSHKIKALTTCFLWHNLQRKNHSSHGKRSPLNMWLRFWPKSNMTLHVQYMTV